MKIGRLATRLLVGGLFVGHGMQKLTGDFDGPGLEGTTQMMEKLELEPAKPHAYLVGATETVGGALFALGAATPLAASALIGSMVTAIRKVHGPNGPWVTDGGYEYNLVLIAAILGVVDGGPGAISIDRLRGKHETGLPTALAALALGAGASTALIEWNKRKQRAPQAISLPDSRETAAEASPYPEAEHTPSPEAEQAHAAESPAQ
jgi:putative oxidoreductase